jgi:hypothetical protein
LHRYLEAVMSHTPGPWELDDEMCVYGYGPNGGDLWICSNKSANDADAFLISAAPDLLAIAELALPMIQHFGSKEQLEQARAAIKKAKGQ